MSLRIYWLCLACSKTSHELLMLPNGESTMAPRCLRCGSTRTVISTLKREGPDIRPTSDNGHYGKQNDCASCGIPAAPNRYYCVACAGDNVPRTRSPEGWLY